jgi:uncharacterized membrane protein
MALAGHYAQAILLGVQPSGQGWVGWVIVVIVVVFIASTLLAGWHQKARARIAKWRSRHRDRSG